MTTYFKWPIVVTVVGLVLGGWIGWQAEHTIEGALSVFLICAILSVLEISLSFDNAIVNANKLKTMDPVWQRRFLTWGILIAVFGMRVIFPLAIVAVAASISPVEAVRLAWAQPDEYARIMHDAHVAIAAYGGMFLLLVALGYFLDEEKDLHWLNVIETRAARLGAVRGFALGLAIAALFLVAAFLGQGERSVFIEAGLWGILTFLAVDALGQVLDDASATRVAAKGGVGAFLYLEVLDASFSFDGVIGAFALSHNLFVIAIGLGIGAMYVRAMTIMLVEERTLTRYRFIEHGAFYAVLLLALLMILQSVVHIPEVVTGFTGAAIILLSLKSSLKWNRETDFG
ncbi:DUF475 domain-containing protein [Halovulum sp. GXIMD14794]